VSSLSLSLFPSPPLPSPLRAFPARPLLARAPASATPCPRPCPMAARPVAPRPRARASASPVAQRPYPGGPAPTPRRPRRPCAPRSCPGGPATLRLRALAASRPARMRTPRPRALVPRRGLACPRRVQRVLAHATIAARRSTFSLVHFSLF
jgi:hypothetical protein